MGRRAWDGGPWRARRCQFRLSGAHYRHHSRAGQILLRQAIGYRINPKTSVFGGYAYVRTDNLGAKVLDEHRLFQQANFSILDAGKSGVITGRTRIEERFVEGSGEVGWRMRQQIRGALPIGKGLLWWRRPNRSLPSTRPHGARKRASTNCVCLAVWPCRWRAALPSKPDIWANILRATREADRMNHIISLALTINR
jgi:hypothetical protein